MRMWRMAMLALAACLAWGLVVPAARAADMDLANQSGRPAVVTAQLRDQIVGRVHRHDWRLAPGQSQSWRAPLAEVTGLSYQWENREIPVWSLPADQTIPPGEHRLVILPDGKFRHESK